VHSNKQTKCNKHDHGPRACGWALCHTPYLLWHSAVLRGGWPSRARDIFSTTSRPAVLYSAYRGPYPKGVKWPGLEADHSPLTSSEVKNVGAIPQLHDTSLWRSP
jgi:hypothetical protein